MRATFQVEFDEPAWQSMSYADREKWVDEVTDSINEVAYVSGIVFGGTNRE